MVLSLFIAIGCGNNEKSPTISQQKTTNTSELTIQRALKEIVIDGKLENEWANKPWQNIDQKWLGEDYTAQDFSGRYKLSWDQNYLYVFAEIVDDTLIDQIPDGLDRYWDDDCLEVFIDEDASKGNHQYNHNAFAYHIALDGKVTDIGPDSIPKYYNHIRSERITNGKLSHWELAISIFDDSYTDNGQNSAVKLTPNKNIGFAIAYCDNDKSIERENFIGSAEVKGKDKNRGWIDAGIFETMTLKQ